jgi:hypothetical protein
MFEKKLDTDPYLDRLEAADPALYAEILQEFLRRPETKVAITRHERTPAEILQIIANENGAPWIEILSHPNCPPDLIKQRLKKGNDDELIAIAQNCSIDESLIRELAKSSSSPVLTWVCRRPDCPADTLQSIFRVCEEQWESALKRMHEESEANNNVNVI